MSICVNTKSEEFKNLLNRSNYSSNLLELAVHALQNRDENLTFPSLQEVINYLQPTSYESNSFNVDTEGNLSITSEVDKCWINYYATPIILTSRNEANTALLKAVSVFGNDNCKLLELNNGRFELRVAKPSWFATLESLNILPEIKDEMYQIKASAIKNGTFMKAPNRVKTNLTEPQWLQVRTKAFKEWFGDWENAPENASKVVDENGEPLVVYHGSNYENDLTTKGDWSKNALPYATYFAPYKYGNTNHYYSAFLNIKNPLASLINLTEDAIQDKDIFNREIIDKGYDGAISTSNEIDEVSLEAYNAKEIIVTNPNQIKSATDNVGTFDSDNLDINFNLVATELYDVVKYLQEYNLEATHEPDTTKARLNSISKKKHRGALWVKKWGSNIKEGKSVSFSTDLSKSFIEDYLKSLSLENTGVITFRDTKKGTIVEYHPEVLQDMIEESEAVMDLGEDTEAAKLALNVKNFLTQRLGIKFQLLSRKEARRLLEKKGKNLPVNARAFYLDGTAYFIKGYKVTADRIAEECLHPLTGHIRDTNKDLFEDLLKDAKELFPKLHLQIKNTYKSEDVDTELVTQALARVFKQERSSNPEGRKKESFISKFINWLLSYFKGTPAINFNYRKGTLNDLAKIINSDAELRYNKIEQLRFNKAQSVEIFPGYWTREQVEAQQDKVFLFGDNTEDRTNTHHIPTRTQAVIRGLPNAIGIDTKKNRGTSEDSYFTDADFDTFVAQTESAIQQALDSGKTIVLPENGIGTGAAQLRHRAPKLYNYLQQRLKQLRNPRTRINAEYVTPEDFILEENSVQLTDRSNVGTKLGKSGMSNGVPVALVANDVTVQEFFDYIEGKIESPTSKQKQVVFTELAKLGYTKERLQELVKTPEDAQKFIAYHELSHLFNNDLDIYYRSNEIGKENPKNWMLPEKIAIELNATIDAWTRLEREKAEETAIQAVPLDGSKTLAKSEVEEKTIDTQGNEITETINKIDEYMQEQLQITQQVNNLLDDTTLSANEVREVAEQAVWWISDHLTELQQNPEEAVRRYGDVFKGKDISKMSRLDLLKALGPQNVVAMCKEIFSPKNNKFKNLSFIRKARKITNNWQAIMVLAQNYFLENEDFSLVLTPNGEAVEVNTDLNLDADNFNISQDEATIKEIEGNLQEHWQIETKTLDVLRSMSQQVKHALRQLYITDKDSNIETTDYGIKKRINVREATNSILRWTQGSLTLEDMVAKLQEKAAESPWLNALITKLADTSGKETDFQGQFFGTFCKHFQSYSVVIQEDGKYKSINVNESPALTEAMMQISSLQKIGEHPLFTNEGLNKETYNELKESYKEIEEASHNLNLEDTTQRSDIAKTLGYISNIFGYHVTPEMVETNLTTENFKSMYSALSYIMRSLEANKDNREYTPFVYGTKGSIGGNMRAFLKPITDTLEDTAISAFYDSGKMYQSYITPSYTSKLFQKFALTGEKFDQFIQEEYGQYTWFHLGNDLETGWRNDWLRLLVNDENARKIFKHKVALNFNKKTYMRDMSDVEYALSLLTEYFSEKTGENKSKVPAWFRIPMLSNKPSSEFIRFYSERGSNYKDVIAEGLFNIFSQELSRIQTVEMRNLDSKDQRFIKNFDKNGRKFNFLDFMNDYLTGEQRNSELGKLIREKLDGKEINDARLHKLTLDVIKDTMQMRADKIMSEWQEGGIMKGAKDIANIGTSDAEIAANLENFIWNDAYAAMNIMQLTITDIAYYKDAEDLQKRLAQIHAPGIRGNIHAVYKGHEVTDGKERTIYLTDFDNVVSNIIDNVSIVFDRKIANAATDTERKGLEALKEALVGEEGQFRKINVADAQGYNSPTSYRKKALIFGRWSKQAEEVYQKLRKGEYTYSDLQVAFQPLKPFVYSQIAKDMGVSNAPMTTAKMPVQNKNSEYLLIMADAILQGEETGKPNLLRAIYQVMEESHYDENGNYKKDGIDTVQFESTVKSGLTGRINLNPYINVENGEAIAKAVLEASIYQTEDTDIEAINPETGDIETHTVPQKTGLYNKNVVQEIPFEDYCLQQEVPEHFKNHEQIHGSQLRYIIVSELADKDSFGNDAVYTIEGRKVSAKEFKAEYEQTIADNIQDSINELSRELNLSTFNAKERNIALSKILQREILSSPRYGVDLLLACSVDENGRFRIPLGDPIQSKRVEQLINSIIKNRINKQEIAGGPVVQVTNFGTSRQLNIRFKDRNKEDELLLTRNEFDGNDAEYKEYIKENQGGIAYFEVFAPIYTNNLFTQFADKNGNISIEAIEALDPDLLKMIGYRIPTEAKYSMAPLKIVGFLPREAGDGIMLPYDITLLTGSDFDVDKEYLMRLDYDLERTKTSKNELHRILYDELVRSQDGKKLNYTTKNALNDLVRRFLNDPYDKASLIGDKTSKEFLGMTKGAYSKLLKLYVQNAFTLNKPTSGRAYRNNKIVDMTYDVLTHETSAAEMLNPGGFDNQKKTGYMVTVFRDPSNTYTWEQLSSMSIDQLKDLSSKNKNLSFIDTHIQFYKQNAAAGSLIGIFAVNRTAHAVIENEGYQVDVNAACGITEPFTIAGMTFGNNMTIDVRFNREGESVGKVLGSLVASSVDAVKDPVLNLMNINRNTANILNTLIRMGMPWEDAALLLSQSAVSKVLASHSSRSVTENVSLNKVIKERLAQLEKENGISNESPLQKEELTKEELIKGIKDNVSPEIEYKVLKSILNISKLSTALRLPTFATRFNSISSAVGPLIIDNLAMEYNLSDLNANTKILDAEGNLVDVYDILRSHPILAGFAESLGIARNLFSTMPANSTGFRGILDGIAGLPVGKAILNDRSLLSKLSDFYQSYLAIAGGVVNEDRLIPVITRFPKRFIERGYKDKYKDNFLIQSIKYGTDKSGKGTLKIDTTGLDETVKQRLSSAWLDLHKENPELSLELFEYCFFRGGMGFSPKSFMNLVPVQVKEQIPKYVETYRILPATMAHLVFDQFVRNNWDNKSLVPLKSTRTLSLETGSSKGEVKITKPEQVENMKRTPYFKIRVGDSVKMFRMELATDTELVYKEVAPLGNNKDYLEISTSPIDKAKELVESPVEDTTAEEVVPMEEGTQIEEVEVPQTQVERQVEQDLLYQVYQVNGRTREEAEQNINKFKTKTEAEKKVFEKQIKSFIEKRFKELGIEYNEELIDKVYKLMC